MKVSHEGLDLDRISMLPDEALCYILSYLPSKEATRTSILSTRWRSVWTMVPVIDFLVEKKVTFSSHVLDKLIKSQRTTQHIQRFRLKCENHPPFSPIKEEWVSAAVAGKVEYLNITVKCPYYYHVGHVLTLPATLFTCATLVTLKLKGCVALNDIPSSVHLPSLKILKLRGGFLRSVDFARLLCGCPAIEALHVGTIMTNSWSNKRMGVRLVRNPQRCELGIHLPPCRVVDVPSDCDRNYSCVVENFRNVADALQRLITLLQVLL